MKVIKIMSNEIQKLTQYQPIWLTDELEYGQANPLKEHTTHALKPSTNIKSRSERKTRSLSLGSQSGHKTKESSQLHHGISCYDYNKATFPFSC